MDIRSKDVLKEALKRFDGTLIVVSHDRDFLEGLVDKLYEFRDGKVREHLGGVEDFLRRRKLENLQELERNNAPSAARPAEKEAKTKPVYNAQNKEQRKLKNRVDWLEKEIGKLEKRMKEIEEVLAAPGPRDDIMELTREYLECKRTLDGHTEEWTDLMEKLEG